MGVQLGEAPPPTVTWRNPLERRRLCWICWSWRNHSVSVWFYRVEPLPSQTIFDKYWQRRAAQRNTHSQQPCWIYTSHRPPGSDAQQAASDEELQLNAFCSDLLIIKRVGAQWSDLSVTPHWVRLIHHFLSRRQLWFSQAPGENSGERLREHAWG